MTDVSWACQCGAGSRYDSRAMWRILALDLCLAILAAMSSARCTGPKEFAHYLLFPIPPALSIAGLAAALVRRPRSLPGRRL